jgi:peptide/nickel transport system permease protein
VRRYLGRKVLIYTLTLFVAVTINWALLRFMPGDPARAMLNRQVVSNPTAYARLEAYYVDLFGLDVPMWQQYLNYWRSLLSWPPDLGLSTWAFPRTVSSVILGALPYTLALLIPAILLSWYLGNKLGALAARRKVLDNTALPISYQLTSMPYMFLAMLMVWFLGAELGVLPLGRAYSGNLIPAFTWKFISDLAQHWFMPFLSLFLVALGGWAIGMRNLVIYELESDYANYLGALGAPNRLIRRYAFRNAVLPQVTGLALQIGVILGGAVLTEAVFSYPGLGLRILNAISDRDWFLLQGLFLFIVIMVLVCNFVVDLVYIWIDPRTRTGLQGASV